MANPNFTINYMCAVSFVENALFSSEKSMFLDFAQIQHTDQIDHGEHEFHAHLHVRCLFRGERSPFSPNMQDFPISLKIDTPTKSSMASSNLTFKNMCEVSSGENTLLFLHINDFSGFCSKSTHRRKHIWRVQISHRRVYGGSIKGVHGGSIRGPWRVNERFMAGQ